MRESHELAFLPALMAGLSSEAENIDISAVRIERRDLEEDLQAGEIDVAIDVALPLSSEVRREHVRSDPLAVLARSEHPAVQGSLDIATYLSLDHVLVTGRRRGGGYEDLALGQLGMSRRIRVRCQSHAAACGIVARSTLLATMPRRQAEIANLETGNQLLPFPADIPPLDTFMYWHANVDADPGSQWLKAALLELLGKK